MKNSFIKKLLSKPNFTLKNTRISTIDEYLSLPKEEREVSVWFWFGPWYLQPYAMAMDWSFDPDEENYKGWRAFDKYVKKEYPIQYFFRNLDELSIFVFLNSKKYKIQQEIIYPIKCFFNSRNKNIQKQIPNTYKPIGYIIEDVLFEIFLNDYLPDKKENWETDSESGIWPKKALECHKIYNWTQERKKLKSEIKEKWLKHSRRNYPKNVSYEEIYGEINSLEKNLEDGDTEALKWIVENRFLFD